jgi:hypothetical protein
MESEHTPIVAASLALLPTSGWEPNATYSRREKEMSGARVSEGAWLPMR